MTVQVGPDGVTEREAVLLAVLGSLTELRALVRTVPVAGEVAPTRTVTVADWLGAKVPTEQVTGAVPVQPVALWNRRLPGSVTLTVTDVAVPRPRLVTRALTVESSPTTGTDGATVGAAI
jgi:hypothetical protein